MARHAIALALLCVAAACSSFATVPGPPDAGSNGDSGVEAGAIAATSAYRTRILADQPLAYWRMGTLIGGSVADETGRNNTLTFQGPGYGGSSVPPLVEGALAGDPDRAVHCDHGTTAVAADADALAFVGDAGAGGYSIEVWIRPMDDPGDGACPNDCYFRMIVEHARDEAGYQLYGSVTREVSFYQGAGPDPLQVGVSSNPLPSGAWAHVVAVREPSRIMLYVNNVEFSNGSAAPLLPRRASEFRVARRTDGERYYYLGDVDELALYGRPLTAAEVAAHYVAGLPR